MATIIHFDIGADNLTRAKEFYEKLFDWKFQLLPGPLNYYIIETKDLEGQPGPGGGTDTENNQFGLFQEDKNVK